jgi:rubrerythrin
MTMELRTHISEELEMLKRGEEIGVEIKDRNTKKLFDIVIDDERRHHQILVELLNIIEKVDEMSREDWYRQLYNVTKAEKRTPRVGRKKYIQRGRSAT